MLKRNQLLIIVVLTLLFLAIGLGSTQNEPISKEALIAALQRLHRTDSQKPIIDIIRKRGVDFELTEEIKQELKQAGATPEFVEAVGANYRKSPAAQAVTGYAGIGLVWIPPGSFEMGDKNGADYEKPVHHVTISNGFYLGKFEVTQVQWEKVMGQNPSHFRGDNLPVDRVTWKMASDFVDKLNQQDSVYVYRLPTEAEWEYAARAGTTSDYAGQLDAMGWYVQNSGRLNAKAEDLAVLRTNDSEKYLRQSLENGGQTHPVGGKMPNRFGLFDMHGNVWEWCEDSFHGDYSGAPTDGSAWLGGPHAHQHVLRGGSWIDLSSWCRSATRAWELPNFSFTFHIGLRVVAEKRR